MKPLRMRNVTAALLLITCLTSGAQEKEKRKIIIDQDAAGPAGTDQQAILLLIQSPQTEVLGITVVTGDAWLTEESPTPCACSNSSDAPTSRSYPGPNIRWSGENRMSNAEQRYGSVAWLGAWTPKYYHPPDLGAMPEGKPTTWPAAEDAAHFLIRMVHKYPHEVTIYEGGPMTNLALAITLDPEFAGLAKELVFMGASLNPRTDDPEFVNNPRHEFNLWFDPEAAHIVLRAPWKKIVCTPVDISLKTSLTQSLIDQVKAGKTPVAKYIGAYAHLRGPYNYLWDELTSAAWLDPTIITKTETRYMDVNLDRGASYGDTLTWHGAEQAQRRSPPVEVQDELNLDKFYKMFVDLLTGPTPEQINSVEVAAYCGSCASILCACA